MTAIEYIRELVSSGKDKSARLGTSRGDRDPVYPPHLAAVLDVLEAYERVRAAENWTGGGSSSGDSVDAAYDELARARAAAGLDIAE